MSRGVKGRSFAAVLLAIVAAGVGGCGRAAKADDAMSGTVKVGDRVLKSGYVALHYDSGKVVRSRIYEDGTYNIRTPPPGEVRVVIEPGDLPVMRDLGPRGGGKAAAEKAEKAEPTERPAKPEKVNVPARYMDLATTDLRLKVEGGPQHHDIVMQPE
jgi:hypothetical protein